MSKNSFGMQKAIAIAIALGSLGFATASTQDFEATILSVTNREKGIFKLKMDRVRMMNGGTWNGGSLEYIHTGWTGDYGQMLSSVGVYIIDGKISNEKTLRRVMNPGKRIHWFFNANILEIYSTPYHTEGDISAVGAGDFKVFVRLEGPEHSGQFPENRHTAKTFPTSSSTLYKVNGKASTRTECLHSGDWVRIYEAREQTILGWTDEALVPTSYGGNGANPSKDSLCGEVWLTGYKLAPGKYANERRLIYTRKYKGVWENVNHRITGEGPYFYCDGMVYYMQTAYKNEGWGTGFGKWVWPGRRAILSNFRTYVTNMAFVLDPMDDDAIEGRVRSFDGSSVIEIDLIDRDATAGKATVKLDTKPLLYLDATATTAAELLKPGRLIRVLNKRPLTVCVSRDSCGYLGSQPSGMDAFVRTPVSSTTAVALGRHVATDRQMPSFQLSIDYHYMGVPLIHKSTGGPVQWLPNGRTARKYPWHR